MQLLQVIPVLVSQKQCKVNNQKSRTSADSCRAVQEDVVAFDFDEVVQVLTCLEELLDVVFLLDVTHWIVYYYIYPSSFIIS